MTGPKYQLFLHRIIIGVSTMFLPLFFACGDGNGKPDPDPDPPQADSIALNPSSVSFDAIGDTVRVTATAPPEGDPDDASTIHTSYGGGIWFSIWNRAQVFRISVAKGDVDTLTYFGAGFYF